jgi:hypothetical protein
MLLQASTQIGKMKWMCDIEPGILKDDYMHPLNLDNTNIYILIEDNII